MKEFFFNTEEAFTNSSKTSYKSKEYISSLCRDIIEDLLRETYDEENPLTTASVKQSQGTQVTHKDIWEPQAEASEKTSKKFLEIVTFCKRLLITD